MAFDCVPLPMGMTTPSSMVCAPLGSGAVLPIPLVLCLPAGSLSTYLEWVNSYLCGGREKGRGEREMNRGVRGGGEG